MHAKNRHFCTAVLLIVLLSGIALSLHAATHFPTELANCELCTGQANPSHAIPPSHSQFHATPAAVEFRTVYSARLPANTDLFPYHQRAPPFPA